MAISATAADIRPLPGAIIRRFTAGGSLTPGDPVAIGTAGSVSKASANASASAMARGVVVADRDGSTSYTSGDAVDVVLFGPVAGFSSIDEEKDVYVGGTNTALTHTAPTAGKVAGSTAYQWIIGHGSDDTGVLIVNARGWYQAAATAS